MKAGDRKVQMVSQTIHFRRFGCFSNLPFSDLLDGPVIEEWACVVFRGTSTQALVDNSDCSGHRDLLQPLSTVWRICQRFVWLRVMPLGHANFVRETLWQTQT